MWGDLHIHSTFSDGRLTVPELVDLFGSRGFGAIAVTDHLCEEHTVLGRAAHLVGATLTRESFPRYTATIRAEAERAWDQYRMVVLPGFEVSKNAFSNHRSTHIVALGVTEYISADGEPEAIARAIRNRGGVAVAAHPVFTGRFEKQTYYLWDHRRDLSGAFDAWEVSSSDLLLEDVLESRLPIVANSDFHSAKHLESWRTVFRCDRTPDAVLDAVRKQKLSFDFYRDRRLRLMPLRPRLAAAGA